MASAGAHSLLQSNAGGHGVHVACVSCPTISKHIGLRPAQALHILRIVWCGIMALVMPYFPGGPAPAGAWHALGKGVAGLADGAGALEQHCGGGQCRLGVIFSIPGACCWAWWACVQL